MEDEQLRSQVHQNIMKEAESVEMIPDVHRKLCVICLESISEHSLTDPCAHAFDFLCIVNWLERTPTCPLCKTQVRTVHYNHTNDHTFEIYSVLTKSSRSTTSEEIDPAPDRNQQLQEPREQQLHSSRSNDCRTAGSAFSTGDSLSRRRHIYHRQLYSLHVGSNQISHFQELTPKRFRKDEELITRARIWIRRELQVFTYLVQSDDIASQCGSRAWWMGNPEYLLEWIIAMLKSVNIKDSSGKAEDMLQEILGRNNARLFLHELRGWLRSPFHRLRDWDQHVQYNEVL